MESTTSTDFDRTVIAGRLASRFDREYCVLTGRATTGLALVLRALSARRVLYPAYICPSPVYATEYAGATPVFCELSIEEHSFEPRALDRELDTGDVDAVLVPHTLGSTSDMARVRDIAADHDVDLIEDAALTVGGERDGVQVGAFGRASLLSFGGYKPISLGTGGAVLTDDPTLAKAVRCRTKNLPTLGPDRTETLRQHLYELYSSIRAYQADSAAASRLLNALPTAFRELYLHDFPPRLGDELATSVATLGDRRALLRSQRSLYASELEGTRFELLTTDEASCPAVFPVLTSSPADRTALLDRLTDDGCHAWALKEPVYRRYEETEYPAADRLYDRALALPMGPDIEPNDIRSCCQRLVASQSR